MRGGGSVDTLLKPLIYANFWLIHHGYKLRYCLLYVSLTAFRMSLLLSFLRIVASWLAALLFLSILSTACYAAQAFDLTTELEREPLGLDTEHPRFSWKMEPGKDARGQFQTAYQILIATDPKLLERGRANVWDSGRVEGWQSVLVEAPGLSLQPQTRYYWTVRLWDEANRAGAYAEPTSFETGILKSADWFADGARWIESPVETINDEEVDHWAKHTIFNVRASRISGGRPTPEDYQEAEDRFNSHLRERVFGGSRLRKEFDAGAVTRARLYISGLGYYRAWINADAVGEGKLMPSDSHFFANVYYQVYDVTDLLQKGKNILAVELVNGRWRAWFGKTPETYNDRPVLIARLEMEDAHGNRKVVVTDDSWRAGDTPRRKHGFWNGELYDARKEQPNWQGLDFDAKDWVPARVAKVGKRLGTFTRDPLPPQEIVEWVKPSVETEPKPGIYVFDFGRIIGGRARFTFQNLKEGQRIVVRYSEVIDDRPYDDVYALAYYDSFTNNKQQKGMLKFVRRSSTGSDGHIRITRADGTVKQGSMAGATAYTDMFVSTGQGEETWQPDFTYTGFRYLEVLGLESRDQLQQVDAFNIRTSPQIVGALETDNAKLNKILKGAQNTILLNYHSQLQDNLGGERNPNALNIALNDLNTVYWIDTYPLWKKVGIDTLRIDETFDWPVNMVAGMRDIGAKNSRAINISNSLHYGHLPWNLIAFFDDRRMAGKILDWSLRFVKETSEYTVWNRTHGSSDHIAESSLLHLPSQKLMVNHRLTSPQFVKSGFIIRIGKLATEVAEVLGREDDVRSLKKMLDTFQKRVAKTYRSSESGEWTPEYPLVQGRNATLMWFMMEPRPDDRELTEQIVEEIHNRTNGHQVTGSRLSYPLIHLLSQHGHKDEALRLLEREEYPSLLNMINETGGSIREGWDTRHSFAQIEGLSAMSNWFYSDLVGIWPDLDYPAFAHFSLVPHVPKKVGDVDFKWNSPRGMIKSHWQRTGGKVVWHIVVPPNSAAEISIPADSAEGILEGGVRVADRPEVSFLREATGRQVFKIGSGTYRFEFEDNSI